MGSTGRDRVDIVAGGYEDWVKQRRAAAAPKVKKEKAAAPARISAASTKLSYKDQRDLDRLPDEIDRIEREIAADEAALHDPDLYAKNPERFAALTKAIEDKRAAKEAAEMRWLEVAEMAEGLGR